MVHLKNGVIIIIYYYNVTSLYSRGCVKTQFYGLKAQRSPFQIRSLQVAEIVITSRANRHYQCLNSSIFTRTPIPSKRQLRCATNQPSEKALVENP